MRDIILAFDLAVLLIGIVATLIGLALGWHGTEIVGNVMIVIGLGAILVSGQDQKM